MKTSVIRMERPRRFGAMVTDVPHSAREHHLDCRFLTGRWSG